MKPQLDVPRLLMNKTTKGNRINFTPFLDATPFTHSAMNHRAHRLLNYWNRRTGFGQLNRKQSISAGHGIFHEIYKTRAANKRVSILARPSAKGRGRGAHECRITHTHGHIRYTDTLAQFNKNRHTDPNLSMEHTARHTLLRDNKTELHTSFLVLVARAQSLWSYYPERSMGPQNSGACNSCWWRPKKPREEIEFQGRGWWQAKDVARRQIRRTTLRSCRNERHPSLSLALPFSIFAAIFFIHAQSSSLQQQRLWSGPQRRSLNYKQKWPEQKAFHVSLPPRLFHSRSFCCCRLLFFLILSRRVFRFKLKENMNKLHVCLAFVFCVDAQNTHYFEVNKSVTVYRALFWNHIGTEKTTFSC